MMYSPSCRTDMSTLKSDLEVIVHVCTAVYAMDQNIVGIICLLTFDALMQRLRVQIHTNTPTNTFFSTFFNKCFQWK